MATKNGNNPAVVRLVADPDTITVDHLLQLEESKTVREMIDALVGFVRVGAGGDQTDAETAERLIRSMSIAELWRQRAELIDQFQKLQSGYVPN